MLKSFCEGVGVQVIFMAYDAVFFVGKHLPCSRVGTWFFFNVVVPLYAVR